MVRCFTGTAGTYLNMMRHNTRSFAVVVR